MIGLVDNMTEDDEKAVHRLFALLIDAPACKARLDELQRAKTAAEAPIKQNEMLLEELAKGRAEVDKIFSTAKTMMDSAERWNEQLKLERKALNEKLGDHADRELALVQLESDLKHREAKAGERETTMDHRESNVAERETAVEKRAAEVEALLKNYDEARHAAALKLAG